MPQLVESLANVNNMQLGLTNPLEVEALAYLV